MGLAVALLVVFEGASVRSQGEDMQPGLERDVVLAVGKPAGWVADRLPFDEWADEALDSLSEDEDLAGAPGFERGGVPSGGGGITKDSFDPAALGEPPKRRVRLRTLLATGDSMIQPLDVELARRLAGDGVRVEREPKLGSGVSTTDVVDWAKLSAGQARKLQPDAVVVFIGANDGYAMPGPRKRQVACCGPEWAAIYATRVRRIMGNYLRGGAERVYWLTLPSTRSDVRKKIARAVNSAIDVASVPFRSRVRVIDLVPTFTPAGRYRGSMEVGGRERVVRQPDGIHLNETGAELAVGIVLAALERDLAR